MQVGQGKKGSAGFSNQWKGTETNLYLTALASTCNEINSVVYPQEAELLASNVERKISCVLWMK